MRLLSKAALFIGSMAVAATTFANATTITRCPSVSAIKAKGVEEVIMSNFSEFLGLTIDQYDTDQEWLFAIGPINSDDEDSALAGANDAVAKINGASMPEEEDGVVVCEYLVDSDEIEAVAISEVDGNNNINTLQKLKAFKKHR